MCAAEATVRGSLVQLGQATSPVVHRDRLHSRFRTSVRWGMAGGMVPGRSGLTLAERSALARGERLDEESAPQATAEPAEQVQAPATRAAQLFGPRHCWVAGLTAGRCPGLLVEWSRRGDAGQPGGGWFGRVVYAVVDDGQVVLVEAWVPAAQLEPAAG